MQSTVVVSFFSIGLHTSLPVRSINPYSLVTTTSGSRVRLWKPHGERGSRTYNVALRQSWQRGKDQGGQGTKPPECLPEAETIFCICTTPRVGQFVIKCVFAEQKKFVGRLGACPPGAMPPDPLDPPVLTIVAALLKRPVLAV